MSWPTGTSAKEQHCDKHGLTLFIAAGAVCQKCEYEAAVCSGEV
jgi:hypothetical protein